MSQRMEFILRLERGENMTDLCKEFGISRKTGYKFWNRFKDEGAQGIFDKTRRPFSSPKKTNASIADALIDLKMQHLNWGAKKIRELFIRKFPHIKAPSRSTIERIFDRNNLVKTRKRRRRTTLSGTVLKNSSAPNELWGIDFKGQFRLGDRSYCYPLTISDHYSRYLIGCEALESTKMLPVVDVFEEIFCKYGIPQRIRSDNGTPFASTGILGLSKLSVWFLRLGIGLERIAPGHPEQNGRHERIHLTLKQEATLPAEKNLMAQQQRFDNFMIEYNNKRPHEALKMKMPSEVYEKSNHKMPNQLKALEYQECDDRVRVGSSGDVYISAGRIKKDRIFIGEALVGENIGVKLVDNNLFMLKFMNYELGYYDLTSKQFLPIE